MNYLPDLMQLESMCSQSRIYTDAEISGLAALVMGAFNEMKARSVSISISATGWTKRGTDTMYKCTVNIAGLRETDRVDICVDPSTAMIAAACGLYAICDSVDGGVVLYADSAAAGTIKATALINRMGG